MLTLEIGGNLLLAVVVGALAVLVVQWWGFRAGARR
jgi:hypothetical protein